MIIRNNNKNSNNSKKMRPAEKSVILLVTGDHRGMSEDFKKDREKEIERGKKRKEGQDKKINI